jgi:hypothetical protein
MYSLVPSDRRRGDALLLCFWGYIYEVIITLAHGNPWATSFTFGQLVTYARSSMPFVLLPALSDIVTRLSNCPYWKSNNGGIIPCLPEARVSATVQHIFIHISSYHQEAASPTDNRPVESTVISSARENSDGNVGSIPSKPLTLPSPSGAPSPPPLPSFFLFRFGLGPVYNEHPLAPSYHLQFEQQS